LSRGQIYFFCIDVFKEIKKHRAAYGKGTGSNQLGRKKAVLMGFVRLKNDILVQNTITSREKKKTV